MVFYKIDPPNSFNILVPTVYNFTQTRPTLSDQFNQAYSRTGGRACLSECRQSDHMQEQHTDRPIYP